MATTSSALAQFDAQLETIRREQKLTRVTDELEGMPISALPDGVYGYSYSQPADEMPLFAARQFQCFEWQKRTDGTIVVIGFAKPDEAAALLAAKEPVDFNLFPEPFEAATALVILEGRRIRKAKAPSRSNGNYMALHTEPLA
jgi:hypothetical protein